MADPLPTNVLLRHPVLAGLSIGLTLALTVALFASDSELKPGDTRPMIVEIVTAFFAPVTIVTLYVVRFASSTAESRALMRVLWPVAGGIFSLVIIWTAITDWNAVQRYAHEGKSTQGKVVDFQPQNHNLLLVNYSVDGTPYQRSVSAPGNAGDNRPGEEIEIYYYASAPSEGFCRIPQWQPATTLEAWFLMAGIGSAWLAALGGCFHTAKR